MTYEHARIVNIELDGAKRGIQDYGFQLSPVDRLVQALIRCPGITEISLGSVFTPTDFFNGARHRVLADTLSWSYRITSVIDQAVREGVVRKTQCLDPAYHSYFAVKTQVTV